MKIDALTAIEFEERNAGELSGQIHCRVRRALEKEVHVIKGRIASVKPDWLPLYCFKQPIFNNCLYTNEQGLVRPGPVLNRAFSFSNPNLRGIW
jgi:hypothetical protein